MTQDHIVDLLTRAAVRLSRHYFEAVENDRDCRWDGECDDADVFREEAEETRSLIEECRTAADRLSRDGGRSPLRNRALRGAEPAIPAA